MQQPPPQYPPQGYPPSYHQPYFKQPYYPSPPMPPPKKPHRSRLIAASVIGILLLSACVVTTTTHPQNSSGTASSNTTQATDTPVPTDTPTPTPSLAYQLASLDAGGYLSEGDPSIAKYQALLDSLHKKTGDAEQTIADETVRGQQLLHDKGKEVKLLDLLAGVNTAISSKSEHIHYAEALAALITLIESNQ